MSRLFMIALIKENTRTVKIRFLNYESVNKYEIADIDYKSVINTIKAKGNGCIQNLALDNGELKGVNGAIDRYGVIENGKIISSSIVIIDKVIDDSGNALGYDCCGANGKVWRLRTADLMPFVYKNGLANGKLVNIGGKSIISAIEGNYSETKLILTTDNKRQQNSVDTNVTGNIELIFESIGNNTEQVCGIADREYKGDIVIPKEHNGKKVVSIRSEAFRGAKIHGVKISEEITDIGQRAFENCKLLKVVDLSAGKHKFIANSTFKDCVRLENIHIGNSVEKIHEYAFARTVSLDTVNIPKATSIIARHAFEYSGISKVNNHGSIRSINDSAFEKCDRLKEFNFNGVTSIGSRAFAGSGITWAIISNTVSKIGRYAFFDCKLEEVNIEEGVAEICEYAFASCDNKNKVKQVYIPKSVKIFGNNSLSAIDTVFVFHGSVAESYCIGHGIHYDYIDNVNNSNSNKARLRAGMLNTSLLEILAKKISSKSDENIEVELDKTKLLCMPIDENMQRKMGIYGELHSEQQNNKECGWEFMEMVNYITATHELYKTPLDYSIMRCYNIMYIEHKVVYCKGGNAIIKMVYYKKDNLDRANFIIIIMDNNLVYVCEDDNTTEIKVKDSIIYRKDYVDLLHAGDTIGVDGVISGEKAGYMDDGNGNKIHLGKTMSNLIYSSTIEVVESAHESYHIVIGSDKVIKIADQRTYDKDKKVRRGTPDYLNIAEIISKEELYKRIKSAKKPSADNRKLFSELRELEDRDVVDEANRLSTVFPESISELYIIATKFREVIGNVGKEKVDISMMSTKLFQEIANTYWIVEKDIQWFSSIGKQSLNLVAKYNIENNTVDEYISNQIVKFYNPYMQGGKGAHVFVMKNKSRIIGVYASRLSLKDIANKLYEMTDYNMELAKNTITPMSEVRGEVESVDARLFFKFYDVLERNNGWRYSNGYTASNCEFAISMYKPTGVLYIVIYDVQTVQEKNDKYKRILVCKPIFKVGDIDRALEIANTTNNLKKAKEIASEMVEFATAISNHGTMADRGLYSKYMKARELAIHGEARRSEYEGLINERLSLMIGVNSSDGPKLYNSMYKNVRISYEDYSYEDDTDDEDVYIGSTDEDIAYDGSEDDSYDEDSNISIEIDDNINEEYDDIVEEDEQYDMDEYEGDDGIYDENEGQVNGMIDMMMEMSEEELAEIGLTPEQRDDMIDKIKRGELTV